MDFERVLFVGLGASAICYYRCALPAMFLGADWVGVVDRPGESKDDLKLQFVTGLVRGGTQVPRFDDYDMVVIQQPRGRAWLRTINAWRARGIKVVFEVDDYLHGIQQLPDHDFRDDFKGQELRKLELNMRACDAMICATPFIADQYRRFNAHTFVCRNGLDLARYQLTRPSRETVAIGWAGGTGHIRAVVPWWKRAVVPVMEAREHTCAVSIGMNFAKPIADMFGESRAIHVPFTLIDSYPAAMTLLDIAIAPAGDNDFFRGKSDLRWLEAGALGIPIVADPAVYGLIEDGVTGFTASTAEEAREKLLRLVDDEKLRREVGENARSYVQSERNMGVMADQWRSALTRIQDSPSADRHTVPAG